MAFICIKRIISHKNIWLNFFSWFILEIVLYHWIIFPHHHCNGYTSFHWLAVSFIHITSFFLMGILVYTIFHEYRQCCNKSFWLNCYICTWWFLWEISGVLIVKIPSRKLDNLYETLLHMQMLFPQTLTYTGCYLINWNFFLNCKDNFQCYLDIWGVLESS